VVSWSADALRYAIQRYQLDLNVVNPYNGHTVLFYCKSLDQARVLLYLGANPYHVPHGYYEMRALLNTYAARWDRCRAAVLALLRVRQRRRATKDVFYLLARYTWATRTHVGWQQ
jgi:hypothetical protein